MKKLFNFKLSKEAEAALAAETERTGKTMTGVVEDALLWRRLFADEAERIVGNLAAKHHLPPRKVVEICVLKAAGGSGKMPFEHLMAA